MSTTSADKRRELQSAADAPVYKYFIRARHQHVIAGYNRADRAPWAYDAETDEHYIYHWYEGSSSNYEHASQFDKIVYHESRDEATRMARVKRRRSQLRKNTSVTTRENSPKRKTTLIHYGSRTRRCQTETLNHGVTRKLFDVRIYGQVLRILHHGRS